MTSSDILTLAAILVGPVLAVLVTRYLDDRRFKQERRYQLYKALMTTRRNKLSIEHINALNLIEIEFNNERSIVRAWKDYFHNLSSTPATEEQWQQVVQEREILFTKLIFEMTKALKIKGIDQIDIMKGGYSPNHWANIEQDQNTIRQSLVRILKGDASFPVFFGNGVLPIQTPQSASLSEPEVEAKTKAKVASKDKLETV